MKDELARVPVGTRVKARGCPGLGVGVVRELITEHRYADGRVIPFRGFVEALVWFPDDFEGVVERFKTRELFAAAGAR